MLSAKWQKFCLGLNELTYCFFASPFDIINLINIVSCNGLLPDSTKPLPEPILTGHQWDSDALCRLPEGVSQEMIEMSVANVFEYHT